MSLPLFSGLLFIAQWLTEEVSLEKCNHHHELFDKLESQVCPQASRQHCSFWERKEEILNSFPFPLFLLIIEHFVFITFVRRLASPFICGSNGFTETAEQCRSGGKDIWVGIISASPLTAVWSWTTQPWHALNLHFFIRKKGIKVPVLRVVLRVKWEDLEQVPIPEARGSPSTNEYHTILGLITL